MGSGPLQKLGELVRGPKSVFWRFRTLGEARIVAKRIVVKASRLVWRVPLDREHTIRMLDGYEIHVADDGGFRLPDREPVAGNHPPQFHQRNIDLVPEYVWRLEPDRKIRSMRITSSGTVRLNGSYLLDTDFGSLPGIADRPWKRRRLDADIAILPWSHKWATYYEFVIHILSKLCRIKEAIDPSSWATAKVCYPLLNSGYERQYLSLLGLSEDAVLDTRRIDLRARSIVISNLQSRVRLPSPTRLAALRREFLGEAQRTKSGGRRMYLSRRGFNRQVLNEADVRHVVSSFGLEFVESIPASVEEQIRMFGEAALIVSPHGSGLANLVWCAPGTKVIELFTRSFTSDVYSYLSLVLGLEHSYLVDDAREPHHFTNVDKDLAVDVRALGRALEDSLRGLD